MTETAKNTLLIAFSSVVIVGAVALGVYSGLKDREAESIVAVTDEVGKAPNFSGLTTDGLEISLADYEGQVVVLDFWATWCPPCRAKMPELIALQDEYRDKGVQFIGVSADVRESDLQEFIADNNVNFPTIFDGADAILKEYRVNIFPTVMIIDREGRLIYNRPGGDDLKERLAAIVASG